jgi:hypothetical protein
MIFGARQTDNYYFSRTLFLIGLGFSLAGYSSWCIKGPFYHRTKEVLSFLPHGLVMCLYGTLFSLLGFYVFLRRFWAVGSGFNEYNKEAQQVHIFRWGFPGGPRRLEFFYSFAELEALCIETRERSRESDIVCLSLLLTDQRKIPLTSLDGDEVSLPDELEQYAIRLAKFIQIPMERTFSRTYSGFIHLVLNENPVTNLVYN